MKDKLISVIVPVYNVEKYLSKCIKSILSQTYPDFELLLIDDGSTDKSGEICDDYATRDQRVRVFHKKNGGVSSARNFGIDEAKGRWITFVDSDDILDKDYIEKFGIKDENAIKGVDLFVQGFKVIVHETQTQQNKSDFTGRYNQLDAWRLLENVNLINSPVCKLFKSEILQNNGIRFDILTSYGEDHLFCLDYFHVLKTVYISSEAGYNYIHHDGISLTRRQIPIKEFEYYINKCKELQLLVLNNCNSYEYLKELNIRSYSNLKRFFIELHKKRSINNKKRSYYQKKFRKFIDFKYLTTKQKLIMSFLLYIPI